MTTLPKMTCYTPMWLVKNAYKSELSCTAYYRIYRLLHKCIDAHVVYSHNFLAVYLEMYINLQIWCRFVVLRLMPDSSIDLWHFVWGCEPVTPLWQLIMTNMLQFIDFYRCRRNWKNRKYYFWMKTSMSGGFICLQIWGRIDTIRRVIKTFKSWQSSISYDARP